MYAIVDCERPTFAVYEADRRPNIGPQRGRWTNGQADPSSCRGGARRIRLHAQSVRGVPIRVQLLLRRVLRSRRSEARNLGRVGRCEGERPGAHRRFARTRRQADTDRLGYGCLPAHREADRAHPPGPRGAARGSAPADRHDPDALSARLPGRRSPPTFREADGRDVDYDRLRARSSSIRTGVRESGTPIRDARRAATRRDSDLGKRRSDVAVGKPASIRGKAPEGSSETLLGGVVPRIGEAVFREHAARGVATRSHVSMGSRRLPTRAGRDAPCSSADRRVRVRAKRGSNHGA